MADLAEGLENIILNNTTYTHADIHAMDHLTALNLIDHINAGVTLGMPELGYGTLADAPAGSIDTAMFFTEDVGVQTGVAIEAAAEAVRDIGQRIWDAPEDILEATRSLSTVVKVVLTIAGLVALGLTVYVVSRKLG